ncbi:MAG: SAM-dependent chlorinase/fluorinase [Anaerolineales bacterium]|jgi:S-adenosylmethionine hydrolase
MAIITLTTDFGLRDGFTGVLKGVIWGICSQVQIADISHTISPQNVLEGAFVLQRAAPYFPPGTIHVAVVDPGVGTERRAIAARLGTHFFVGPDNGLCTALIESAEQAGGPVDFVHLTNPRYWLPQVSFTFHGRDIFAPVAAHLANGVPLSDLGPSIKDPIRLSLPTPEKTMTGWRAHVIAVDAFGNLATDLPANAILGTGEVVFQVCGREIRGLVASYGHRPSGELIALVDSENYIEIARVNGNAAQDLGAHVGDMVDIIFPT